MVYAEVCSVYNTLEDLQYSLDIILPSQREEIEFLKKKFTFFKDFLLRSSAANDFVRRTKRTIRCLACRVDNYVAEILFSRSIEAGELEYRNRILGIHDKAQEMFEQIDLLETEILRFHGEVDSAIQPHEENCSQAWISGDALDATFLTILGRVTGYPTKLQIFAIVGMQRMGKTDLAKRIFNDRRISDHFCVCAWSEGSSVREILVGLLKCIKHLTDGVYEKCNGQLSEQLSRSLRGRRYLIVLDNLRCNKVWDTVKKWLPDEENGSRVLLTSRLMNVGVQIHENRSSHHQRFPSAEERRKHFQEILFSDDHNPLELVKVGEQIAREHQGLLLAIVLTAVILSKISDTPNYWGDFMQKAGSITSESVKDILPLNFNELPPYLKSCFSYIGVLPDDCEIFSYIVIRVWHFLGYLRPGRLKRLEEVAKVHLKDLVESSLNMNRIRWSDCRVKGSFIPGLLWGLNNRRAQKEKFLDLIMKSFKLVSIFRDDCHFSFHSEIDLYIWLRPVVPLTRSFQCFGLREWLRPDKWSNTRGAALRDAEDLGISLRGKRFLIVSGEPSTAVVYPSHPPRCNLLGPPNKKRKTEGPARFCPV